MLFLYSVILIEIYAFPFSLMNSTTKGVATNKEEYVPKITPINIAKENPLKISPPKMKMIRRTAIVHIPVITVLLKVLFRALLITEGRSSFLE